MSLLHQISEFLRRQEAWTGLGDGSGHLVVTADDGLGELLLQVEKEGKEGGALLEGAGVLGLAVGIEAAFVTDAY